MPVNITQKDATLHEIIAYCEKKMNDIGNDLDITADHLRASDYSQLRGQVDAYEDIALKCIDMLGYSGIMPLEVTNQSEDAK